MPALVNEINNSKAHKILESWLSNHKAFSGEQLQGTFQPHREG